MVKQATYPVIINGKVEQMRFDIQALMGAQTALKALGFNRDTVWRLADAPYDLGEEIVLLQAGINGAKRLAKDKDMYDMDTIQEMVQDHFDGMAEELSAVENEQEAMKEFQKRQEDLMASISDAVKGAIGFRYKGKRDKPGRKRADGVDA
jgi:hypothetical protein